MIIIIIIDNKWASSVYDNELIIARLGHKIAEVL